MKTKNIIIASIVTLALAVVAIPLGINQALNVNAGNDSGAHPYGESDVQIDYVSCSDKPITSSSYDDSKKYNYSDLTLTSKHGSFTGDVSTGLKSGSTNSIAISDDETNPWPYGTFEVSIKGTTNSTDDGIIFAVDDGGLSEFWEDAGVSYYFFFLGHDGYLALGKVDNTSWTSLFETNVGTFSPTTEYRMKVVNRNNLLIFYLNGTKINHLIMNNGKLKGTKFGIRAGGKNVKFSNFHVTNDYEYGL